MSSSKLVSIAIDFGTTYSGYAFSFRHKKTDIQTFLWKTRNYESVKTPTCILFDSMKRFHSFGLEAEDAYAELSREGRANSMYFFKQFKLSLHKDKDLGRGTKIKEVGKKEMLALDVFAESIRYLKQHAVDEMSKHNRVRHEDIQWVLTVPAIWDDSARQFMRLAAQQAGIAEGDLTLALEPEAASVYCKAVLSNDAFSTVGSKYMVLDCGGGTVDIAVHEVQFGGKLKAIYRPSGGVWGGIKVDDEFQAFLFKLCGREAIQSLTKHDMLQLQRGFDVAKKSVTTHSQDVVKMFLPLELRENIKTDVHEGSYRLIADKITLTAHLMKSFYSKILKKITEHIRSLLMNPDLHGVSHIVMIGGFSESDVLQNAIRTEFPNIDMITVPQTSSAVVRGAVIYGHEPRIIRWRKAAYTYGARISVPFSEGYHDRSKLIYTEKGRQCSHIFDKFVKVNDSIEVGKHQFRKEYGVASSSVKAVEIYLFRCEKPDPIYTTDIGCKKIGSLHVEMPDLKGGINRKIHISVEFGDTEMKVEAVDGNTGVKFSASFDFLIN